MPEEKDIFDSLARATAKHGTRAFVVFTVLIVLDVFLWLQVAGDLSRKDLKLYFLAVGQGDSELVVLPTGVKILIDGGPMNGAILDELGKVLPPQDRYIDLVAMSHPQTDHFGGLIDVFKRYRVGAFVVSGEEGVVASFADLKKAIKENGAVQLVLSAGDKIRNGDSSFLVLSPTPEFLASKDVNSGSLVLELQGNGAAALFTGDIGEEVEQKLADVVTAGVDILKVPHHGSKYSSTAGFIQALKPKIAVIEVGKNNYGHPTEEILNRLKDIGARIFRTDLDKTIKMSVAEGKIKIFEIP
jgi:competence protein ComEC